MSKIPTIAAVDVGTSTVKAIIVQKNPEEAGFKVLGRAENLSSGVRKGVVADPESVAKIIRVTMEEAKREAGQEVDEVYSNINGMHIFSLSSKGLISVSRADQEIAQEDVNRVIDAAKAFSLPANKEILETIPREFIIDREKGIKNPVGLHGIRLETEVVVVGGFTSYSKNLSQAILSADLQVSDLILNPIATARAVLTNQEKELGALVIDFGAGTTGISVYEEGSLLHTAVLPVGTNNIRNDIAIGLKVDIETAEFIKNEFGNSILGEKSIKKEKLKVSSGEEVVFQRNELKKIAEPRIVEILDEIEKELKKISKNRLLPGGVVITGGGSKIPGLVEFTREKLGLPCRLGVPRRFLSFDEDPSLSTLCGLVLCGMDLEEEDEGKINFKGTFSKIKKFFKVFIP
jgi:cell division protein FtsA